MKYIDICNIITNLLLVFTAHGESSNNKSVTKMWIFIIINTIRLQLVSFNATWEQKIFFV